MHIGLANFTDIEYGVDLANSLIEYDVSVTLYMSYSHTLRMVGKTEKPVEYMYEQGLLFPDVKVRLFQLPRMRDPRSFSVMRKISQSIKKDNVDVVHIILGGGELWFAVLACLLQDVPVASTMINPNPNIGEYPPASVVLAVNKILTLGSDVIIVNGTNHIELVKKKYRLTDNRISYVPLGPRTMFKKLLPHNAIPEEKGMVLVFGRINKYKGLEYLVKAQPIITRHIPYARIVIAGQGKDLGRCQQMIQDRTRFEINDGFIPNELAAMYFQRASIVVLPYITAATSGVLMTAYVFSKPVVATRVGSLPEYVQDGVTGILVPPANVEELANAIIQLLSNDSLRNRLGEGAKSWVNGELSWKNVTLQTMRVYESAISLHHGS